MAENNDEKLSPEEKLLRVIQGSGRKPTPNAAREGDVSRAAGIVLPPPLAAPVDSAAIAAEGSAVVVENQPAGPGRLKVAREKVAEDAELPTEPRVAQVAEARTGRTGAAESAAIEREGEPAVAMAVADEPALAKSRSVGLSFNIRTINLILGVLIAVVLVFTGREILGHAQQTAAGRPLEGPVSVSNAVEAGADYRLPELNTVLSGIDQRPIFAPFDVPDPRTPPPIKPPRTRTCVLLGISEMPDTGALEAIIMDNEANKMYFLQVGESFSADGETYTVDRIESDRVLFKYADGTREDVVQ